jgi:hypothetical protein
MDSSDSWRFAADVLGTALLFAAGRGVTALAEPDSRTGGAETVLRSAKLRGLSERVEGTGVVVASERVVVELVVTA